MLIYMLSKEKIEDDYIDKLRLESYQLSSAIWLSVSIIIYGFFADVKISLDYIIFLFMLTYLITFFIKKRIY
jgi:predicted ABC-type exoprotein transport system permease subunit